MRGGIQTLAARIYSTSATSLRSTNSVNAYGFPVGRVPSNLGECLCRCVLTVREGWEERCKTFLLSLSLHFYSGWLELPENQLSHNLSACPNSFLPILLSVWLRVSILERVLHLNPDYVNLSKILNHFKP